MEEVEEVEEVKEVEEEKEGQGEATITTTKETATSVRRMYMHMGRVHMMMNVGLME